MDIMMNIDFVLLLDEQQIILMDILKAIVIIHGY